jgi:hypothetical protein
MTTGTSAGPLVIGGVGGSGTRLVAELAQHLGTSLGGDCNHSLDTLWATLLLRRPEWLRQREERRGWEIDLAFDVLEDAVNGRLAMTPEVTALLEQAEADQVRLGLDRHWTGMRLASLAGAGRSGVAPERWGWKEPSSHHYLRHLHRHYGPTLRYVHVIRNGLDMAYSTNQWQVRVWGWRYGIDAPHRVSPQASVDYWIRANREAVATGADLPAGCFLLVDFDRLCADPASGVDALLRFLELDPPSEVVDKLVALPRAPASTGRWRSGDATFTEEQLEAVAGLGFDVGGGTPSP